MAQSRRDFLSAAQGNSKLITKISEFANKELPKSGMRSALGLDSIAGNLSKDQVIHLLRRCMFGAKNDDINYFTGKTVSIIVDELLTPLVSEYTPTPPLRSYVTEIDTAMPSRDVAYGSTWINSRIAPDNTITNDNMIRSNIINNQRIGFKNWWTGVMINQNRSILEKMVIFWHNHFATETDTVQDAITLYNHHQLLRTNSLGNFKNLLKLISIDPAMLFYLNNRLNTKTAPDENFARELQELFTLGQGSGYTEDDVKMAAKVLTGHSIAATILYTFNTNNHDTGDKQFSSFYGNAKIIGKSGAGGAGELDEFIDLIFAKNETAKYLVRKLYRYFVYYTIDAATETNVIIPLATLLQSSNWEIKPVLKKLLESEHFFDMLSQGCVIKNPADFIVTFMRQFNAAYSVAPSVEQKYNMFNSIRGYLAALQMEPGDPPNVAGWQAYYQSPQYYEMWINSDTYQKRMQFLDAMQNNGITNQGVSYKPDLLDFVKTNISDPSDPNKVVGEFVTLILGLGLSGTHLNSIKKDNLLSGQSTDSYWTTAWNAHIGNPSDNTLKNTVLNRLKPMFNYLLKLEEYQLS